MLTRAQTNCYQENGFLVLKQLLPETEIEMLRQELNWMINSAPIHLGANENRYNQVVEHPEDYAFTVLNPDSGHQVINRISNPLARSEVILRTYGHPKLLQAVTSLYGSDFVPFAESIVIKMPENGAPFEWHQDGNFKTGVQPVRGVNFGIYLYPSTQDNGCLHVIPKSHRWGQANLKSMVEKHGPQLPDSIPVPVKAGDVIVHDRNLIHGSFTNTSPDLRITVYFGYHRRDTVVDVFTPKHIRQREQAIWLAVQHRAESNLVTEEEDGLPMVAEEQPFSLGQFQSEISHFSLEEKAKILRAPPLAI